MTISNPLDKDQTECSNYKFNCPYWRNLPVPIDPSHYVDGLPLCDVCYNDYKHEGIIECYSYTDKSLYLNELGRKQIQRQQRDFEEQWK
jgi:hypothetical protein